MIINYLHLPTITNGDVAQLARVLDWQSRGRRFEPDLLHGNEVVKAASFFCGEDFFSDT